MKITITITQEKEEKSFDIQVPSEQKISDTLQVLRDNLPAFMDMSDAVDLYVADDGRKISVEKTYEQAHIYSGAELLIKS